MSNTFNENVKKSTLLGHELTPTQDVYVNYLIPSICGCCWYILHFAADFTVCLRHFQDDCVLWGFLTLFFVYLPVLSCFLITITLSELWPVLTSCSRSNAKWFLLKIVQHVFFPVWGMWRYSEKIFWSIEGVRANDESERNMIKSKLAEPRTIELYFFLRAYLQCAPEILLHLHIIINYAYAMDISTVYAQVLSMLMALVKMAITTTIYQRFKSQKIGGKLYPWYKQYKFKYDPTIDGPPKEHEEECENEDTESVCLRYEEPSTSRRECNRRSSGDFYELPSPARITEQNKGTIRETSIVDGPQRLLLKGTDETDFFIPRRLVEIKTLPEDDCAGKLVAFLWWFCFLLARMLAISSFSYFYPKEIFWILSSHFILIVALLLYDIRAHQVRRAKAVFFIFIGFVYLFCLIEFKVRFKKTWFIYNGFFILVFTQNFAMSFIWWYYNLENIIDEWWYNYTFYLIIGCSILSLSSIVFYFNVLKPRKVVVAVVPATQSN